MSCADPEDDEEHLNAELREHFPSYLQEDFGEFVHSDLNDIIKPVVQPTKPSSKVHEVITQDDYRLICNSFMSSIVNVSSCYFHKQRQQGGGTLDMGLTTVDRRSAFGLKTEIFKRLFDQFKSTLSDTMDDRFYLGSATMVDNIQKFYEETPVTGDVKLFNSISPGPILPFSFLFFCTGKSYDFYKDSNVQEIVACFDVLQEIRARVLRELLLWPDHAVLNDVSHCDTFYELAIGCLYHF